MPFNWPHAPTHQLAESGAYMVTAGTYGKKLVFGDREGLDALQGGLLKYASRHGWNMEAWAVFPNHYHFVAQSPLPSAASLSDFLREFHSRSARWVNRRDGTSGRKVWHNYWETYLSFEKSYFARLNYVHQNVVKHGVVRVANQYRWCSAAWFERTASQAMVKTVYGFRMDRVKVIDDYEVVVS